MFKRNKVTVIIEDDVQLSDNIINLIEQKSYKDIKSSCIWQQLNSKFKIKPKDFNSQIFAKSDVDVTYKKIMRADPVFVQTGLNGAIVMDNKLSDLSFSEAQKIGEEIKPDLSYFGLNLYIADTHRWYIYGENIPKFTAPPTTCAKDQMLMSYRDNQTLSQLSNQLQITLYNSKINQQRFNLGKTEINNLWFWGISDFTNKTIKIKPSKSLFCDDKQVGIYAKYFGIKLRPISQIKSDITSSVIVINNNQTDNMWQTILNIKNINLEYRGINYQ